MKKLLVLAAIAALLPTLGAAADFNPKEYTIEKPKIADVATGHGELVSELATETIPGKSIEQDTYREGNDAKHEKKTWGQPSFDDLEMERGVKPGDTKLHDWFEDVRAGAADSARKEIAVTPTRHGDDVKAVALAIAGRSIPENSARKGRNPQTGKEIKIPARKVTVTDDDGDGTPDMITVWVNNGHGEFEKEFNISIPDEEAEEISTVGEAIEYLEKNAKS